MHDECVIAEYKSREEARVALEVLETYHFSADSVSVVTREEDESIHSLDDVNQEGHAGHSADKGAGLGTLLGGVVATPIAISTMVAPLLVAGPLAGMAVGAVVGGFLGGTKRPGVNDEASKTYEQRVAAGSVLIVVTDEAERLSQAEHGLKTTNPVSIERFAYSEHGDDQVS